MNNKFLIKMAIVFIIIGGAITFVTFALNDFDLEKFDYSYGTWKEHEYEFSEEVEKIEILEVANDVKFLPSQDEKIHIFSQESDAIKYKIDVRGKNLKIELVNQKKWYETLFYIGSKSFKSADLKIHLPKKEYQALILTTVSADAQISEFSFKSLDLSTTSGKFELSGQQGKTAIHSVSGDIALKNFKTEDLKIQTTSGDVYLEEGKCEQLDISGISAKVKLSDVEAKHDMTIQTVSGNVNLQKVDAKDYDIETVSGDVLANIKTEKNFDIEGFGQKKYPVKNSSSGNFYVTTISGKVEIEVMKK